MAPPTPKIEVKETPKPFAEVLREKQEGGLNREKMEALIAQVNTHQDLLAMQGAMMSQAVDEGNRQDFQQMAEQLERRIDQVMTQPGMSIEQRRDVIDKMSTLARHVGSTVQVAQLQSRLANLEANQDSGTSGEKEEAEEKKEEGWFHSLLYDKQGENRISKFFGFGKQEDGEEKKGWFGSMGEGMGKFWDSLPVWGKGTVAAGGAFLSYKVVKRILDFVTYPFRLASSGVNNGYHFLKNGFVRIALLTLGADYAAEKFGFKLPTENLEVPVPFIGGKIPLHIRDARKNVQQILGIDTYDYHPGKSDGQTLDFDFVVAGAGKGADALPTQTHRFAFLETPEGATTVSLLRWTDKTGVVQNARIKVGDVFANHLHFDDRKNVIGTIPGKPDPLKIRPWEFQPYLALVVRDNSLTHQIQSNGVSVAFVPVQQPGPGVVPPAPVAPPSAPPAAPPPSPGIPIAKPESPAPASPPAKTA